ncbi:MAG: UbiA family prenyltransferase [bacterium]|nr:UbiA family prenyltransferase [bacterium]
MFTRNNFKLLRLPFSLFLMPVFLFALSQSNGVNPVNAGILFVVMHLFVYPASNAYNSFMDQDKTSIGGLKNPPKAEKSLLQLTYFLDVFGLILSVFISLEIALLVAIYILVSRAYSYRGIRLKKFPIIGYLTVIIFQGGFTFYLCSRAFGNTEINWLPIIASSFLIAGVYPLTQIYQHEADKNDGVQTISMLVGYLGTFVLTGIQFIIAMSLLYFYFDQLHSLNQFWFIQICLAPTLVYFFYWFRQTFKNTLAANFENTMKMNAIASTCMSLCFISLTLINQL